MKKQNGEFVGKLAPYGYIKDKHKFLIDKNVSHIIRKIFDMILDGEKLNLSNITRLELENKVKCIYIDKNKNVKIDIK